MRSDATYAAAEADSGKDIDSSCSCPSSLLWPDQEAGAVLHAVLPDEMFLPSSVQQMQMYATVQHTTRYD